MFGSLPLRSLSVLVLCASAFLLAPASVAQDAEPHDPLPPPLVAPVIVPPGEEPVLAPLAGPVINFEERVVEIVNQERAAVGLPPLKGASELELSSGDHSFNMADRDFFAHCDPDTKESPFDRMEAAGYIWSAAAENIAGGFATPEDVMAGWMASEGHRANILDDAFDFREMGVGYFEQPGDDNNVRLDQDGDCTDDGTRSALVHYWTQNFGRRSDVYPLVINRESHDTVCAELQLYVYGPPDAAEMRFSNDGVSWSAWMPYSPETTWPLPGASGSPATVFSEVRNGSTFAAQDEIILGSGFPATSNLNVPQQTVSTTETFQACDTVSATSGFEVAATGDVTFQAGRRIVLGDGFSVASGGTFRAVVDSTL
jgi:uncharacterized protein YkwD